MEIEFITQQVRDHITALDEIILWDCEEDMMNGPHKVASIGEEGEITLVGLRQNEGTVCMIFVGE